MGTPLSWPGECKRVAGPPVGSSELDTEVSTDYRGHHKTNLNLVSSDALRQAPTATMLLEIDGFLKLKRAWRNVEDDERATPRSALFFSAGRSSVVRLSTSQTRPAPLQFRCERQRSPFRLGTELHRFRHRTFTSACSSYPPSTAASQSWSTVPEPHSGAMGRKGRGAKAKAAQPQDGAAVDRGALAQCLNATSQIAAECNSILRDLLRGR